MAFWGYSCMGSQGCSPGMVMASGMELSPPRRSGHAPVEELRVGYWNVAPLWRSGRIGCWTGHHYGVLWGGAGWPLVRICHHDNVLGPFRWGSEGCSPGMGMVSDQDLSPLWRSGHVPVGGAKSVVLEDEWPLIRICHHYGVLGTFRWGELRVGY